MHKTNIIFRLLTILFGLLAGLGLGEGFLRLAMPGEYDVWPPGTHRLFHPMNGVMPGIEGDSSFHVNRHGIRGPELSSDQTFRILTVGGSTTECLYLDDDETWPALLGRTLNAMHPSQNIWVGNAGQSGFSSRHHVMHLSCLPKGLPRIDLVIVMVGINDLLRRLILDDAFVPMPPFGKLSAREYRDLVDESFAVTPVNETRGRGWRNTAIGCLLSHLFEKAKRETLPGFVQDKAGASYGTLRKRRREAPRIRTRLPDMAPALEEYARHIRAMIGLARKQNIQILFVTQATMWRPDLPPELSAMLWAGGTGDYLTENGHDYYSAEALAAGIAMYNRVLTDVARAEGAEVLDIAPRLEKDTTTFYDDFHFNEAGARKVARLLADKINQMVFKGKTEEGPSPEGRGATARSR